jgi:hypothetical protein
MKVIARDWGYKGIVFGREEQLRGVWIKPLKGEYR